MERDIWKVAEPILDDQQRDELRERIETFHRDNPELSTFSHLRFADFPSKRASSTLREDVHSLAVVSDRLAVVAQELPDRLTVERAAMIEQVIREASVLRFEAIEQLLAGVAMQRTDLIEAFAAEEDRLGGLLTELRQTLNDANTLTLSVDTLAQRFGAGVEAVGPPKGPTEPLDIEDVRKTIVETRAVVQELNGLVLTATELLNSPGADRLVPSLVKAIGKVGETSEDLVDHSVIRAALLILLALVGYVIARLCYGRLAMRWLAKAP